MKITDDWESQLRNLKTNWDSYGAEPVTDAAIKSTHRFISILDRAHVIPTSDGGIVLTWLIKIPSNWIDENGVLQVDEYSEIAIKFDARGYYEPEE